MIIRSLAETALIEDLQSILLDVLIEAGLHRKYQADILSSLPGDVRRRVGLLLQEDAETMAYLNDRIRAGLDILGQARTYSPDRPAVRSCPRPLAVERVEV